MSPLVLYTLTFLFLPFTFAQHSHYNGMDMNKDGSMSMASGHMTTYLHFSPFDDTLWFQGWVPSSAGAIVGACIALFLLGVFERWIVAGRAVAERAWDRSAQLAMLERLNRSKDAAEKDKIYTVWNNLSLRGRYIPPFIPAHDIARGILHAVQTTINFLFMLAVMQVHQIIISQPIAQSHFLSQDLSSLVHRINCCRSWSGRNDVRTVHQCRPESLSGDLLHTA
ncbi:hypothetical protein AX17_003825 [Amanita inopinata Kibby_2008]|nr:hypothetical protein AX17_003825 [Amanita inopinata Kibby_2008]